MSIISVESLVRVFGDFAAVDSVSFTVQRGEIFGFLGPNGAGKTTTIRMLSTLLRPTSGTVRVAGFDVVSEPSRVRQCLGMVFQEPSLDDRLTAEENLRFHARLYGVKRSAVEAQIGEVLNMVDLHDRRHTLVKTFSGGMKRRLEIARGFLHRPMVLFLDEPTLGLDPQTRRAIWGHVRRLQQEFDMTVFMTTHYMEEAENCQRIAIIDHGRIQALDTPAALKRRMGGDRVTVCGDDALAAAVSEQYHVQVQSVGGELNFQIADGASFLPRLLADFGNRVRAVAVKQPTIDDVFVSLTGHAIRQEDADDSELDGQKREGKKLWTGRW